MMECMNFLARLLTSLGEVEETVSPIQIVRKDKQRISKMYANLAGGKPLATALAEIGTALDQKGELPPG